MIVLMETWQIKIKISILIHNHTKIKLWLEVLEIQQMEQAKNLQVQTTHQDHFIHQRICTNNNKIHKLAVHTNKIQQEEWETDNQLNNSNHLQE